MRIRCPYSTYSVAAHDHLLQQWEEVRYATGPLQIDLQQVAFFDPYGMCALVLFLNHLPHDALPVSLLLPGWPCTAHEVKRLAMGPVSYLSRMGFWQAVAPCIDADENQFPPRPKWSADRNVLLEITVLRSHEGISAMLRKTGDLLQNLDYSAPARGHILEVLSELCSNVLMHANSPFGGVAAMQTYKRRAGRRYLVMSIGDSGIGVRRSLAANPSLAARLESDAQALGVAVQPGASRFGSGGHGGGLPRVLQIAQRYSGRVAMRSGSGALVYHGAGDARKTFDVPNLVGTELRISLPEWAMKADAATKTA